MRKIVFLSIIILVLTGVVYKLVELRAESITSPTGRINLIAYNPNKGMWFLALNKDDIRGVFVSKDVYIETAYGGGKYPVGKLSKLGSLEDLAFDEFIKDTGIKFLGVHFDGVVISEEINRPEDIKSAVLKSDLPVYDKVLIWKRFFDFVLAKNSIIDLENTRVVGDFREPDGVDIKEADSSLFTISLERLFIEEDLAREKRSIVVVNETRISSLARITSNIIENAGADVVGMENGNEANTGCEARFASGAPDESLTLKRIAQMFDCDIVEEKPEYKIADIEVHIGSGYGKRMFGE